jgi:large subunit ribosomal protein L14
VVSATRQTVREEE